MLMRLDDGHFFPLLLFLFQTFPHTESNTIATESFWLNLNWSIMVYKNESSSQCILLYLKIQSIPNSVVANRLFLEERRFLFRKYGFRTKDQRTIHQRLARCSYSSFRTISVAISFENPGNLSVGSHCALLVIVEWAGQPVWSPNWRISSHVFLFLAPSCDFWVSK